MSGRVTVKCETCDTYISMGNRWCRKCIEIQIKEEE